MADADPQGELPIGRPNDGAGASDTVADITLNQGENVFVFKIVNEEYFWEGCLRFLDAEVNPIRDLRFSTAP